MKSPPIQLDGSIDMHPDFREDSTTNCDPWKNEPRNESKVTSTKPQRTNVSSSMNGEESKSTIPNSKAPKKGNKMPPDFRKDVLEGRLDKKEVLHSRVFLLARVYAKHGHKTVVGLPWAKEAVQLICRGKSEWCDAYGQLSEALPHVKVAYGEDKLETCYKLASEYPIVTEVDDLTSVGVIGSLAYHLQEQNGGGSFYLPLPKLQGLLKLKYCQQAKREFNMAVERGFIQVVDAAYSYTGARRARLLSLGPYFNGEEGIDWIAQLHQSRQEKTN